MDFHLFHDPRERALRDAIQRVIGRLGRDRAEPPREPVVAPAHP
jgi:hypothetical protein